MTTHEQSKKKAILHQVVDDIACWELFHRKSGNIYLVGSYSLDKYLVVPESKIAYTLDFMQRLNGTSELINIQNELEAKWKRSLNIPLLFSKMKSSGLIKTAQNSNLSNEPVSEMIKHSINLLRLNMQNLAWIFSRLTWLFHPACLIIGITAITATFINVGTHDIIRIKQNNHAALSIYLYIELWVIFISLAIVHEIFHTIAAYRYGLRAKNISLSLYLGFIPLIYVYIPGIYTLPPKKRIIIWSAGIYSNLISIMILFLLSKCIVLPVDTASIFDKLVWVNISIIVLNLSPFMATDGYYILSTILKVPNIRTNAYLEFKKWIKRERNNFSTTMAVYTSISIAVITWMLVRLCVYIYDDAFLIFKNGLSERTIVSLWPLAFVAICILANKGWSKVISSRVEHEIDEAI
jgi:putative peptide zinc metalloprotease protein